MFETLFINGYDIQDYVTCVQSLDGLYNIGAGRGDNLVFPGVDGETWVDKPLGTYNLELGLILKGNTVAEFNTMLRDLRKIVSPGQKVSMSRRLAFETGSEFQVCDGEFAGGLVPTLSFQRFGRVTLTMKVLDGCWYEDHDSYTGYGNGPITIGGETRTHNIVLEMPPQSTMTNNTNGHSVTNTRSSGGIVTIDVVRMVAIQDGVDVSHALQWNKRYPMRFEPGVNNISSSSTGNIAYRAAFL